MREYSRNFNISPMLVNAGYVERWTSAGLWRFLGGTQQTRDIEQMLVQCWPAVYDVGPTFNQHQFNVSCLLRYTSQWMWCLLACACAAFCVSCLLQAEAASMKGLQEVHVGSWQQHGIWLLPASLDIATQSDRITSNSASRPRPEEARASVFTHSASRGCSSITD